MAAVSPSWYTSGFVRTVYQEGSSRQNYLYLYGEFSRCGGSRAAFVTADPSWPNWQLIENTFTEENALDADQQSALSAIPTLALNSLSWLTICGPLSTWLGSMAVLTFNLDSTNHRTSGADERGGAASSVMANQK
jgi:hypothetical protein